MSHLRWTLLVSYQRVCHMQIKAKLRAKPMISRSDVEAWTAYVENYVSQVGQPIDN